MGILETRLVSFEQEFAMQRDKIPESNTKQNQAVEKMCINTTVSMTQTQTTMDNLAGEVEELRRHVHDTNSMLMEMSQQFSATTIHIQQNQEAMNQKIDKVNGRLLSLRDMFAAKPGKGPAEDEPAQNTPGPSSSEHTEAADPLEEPSSSSRRQWN